MSDKTVTKTLEERVAELADKIEKLRVKIAQIEERLNKNQLR